MFTAMDVKRLREKTGCGMMDCKEAMVQSNGDMELAIDFLRKKGLAASAKKSSRVASEGVAIARTNEDNTVGAIIEVNSETDFVSRSTEFNAFVDGCIQTIINGNPENIDNLLEMNMYGQDKTVNSVLQEKVLTMGENIKVRRFKRLEGKVSAYVHSGGKIGVLVKFDSDIDSTSEDFKNLGKDVAMQVAAANPKYLSKNSVPSDIVEHEKEILRQQVVDSSKSGSIVDKIVLGRMNKFYKEVCLLDEPFIKDNAVSVDKYVKSIAKTLGGVVEIKEFIRFEKGEGLEKKV